MIEQDPLEKVQEQVSKGENVFLEINRLEEVPLEEVIRAWWDRVHLDIVYARVAEPKCHTNKAHHAHLPIVLTVPH